MNSAVEQKRVMEQALTALCVKCAGWGRVSVFAAVGDKLVRKSEPCPSCGGSGLRPEAEV